MTARHDRVPSIRRMIERGQYRVDPYATADAIIDRMCTWPFDDLDPSAVAVVVDPSAVAPGGPRKAAPQKECSYPDSFRSLSRNSTPAGPSITEPTRVRPVFAASEV